MRETARTIDIIDFYAICTHFTGWEFLEKNGLEILKSAQKFQKLPTF